MTTITKPGLYPQLDEATYLADPVPEGSLSNSGAKRLVPPSTPAHFKAARDGAQERSNAFDIGHAVHGKVLGIGQPVKAIEGNRNANATKAAITEAEAEGFLVLKPDELEQVNAMAEAVLSHPIARVLFKKGYGTPEVSAFWRDEPTKVMLRCRYDWLPDPTDGKRLIVPDLKTTTDADPGKFGKSAANFGYFMQDAHYLDGLAAHDIGDESNAFVFVSVEKTRPFLVSVVQLDDEARALGRRLLRNAIDLYAQCMERDEWPGYSLAVERASLPAWFTRFHEETYA